MLAARRSVSIAALCPASTMRKVDQGIFFRRGALDRRDGWGFIAAGPSNLTSCAISATETPRNSIRVDRGLDFGEPARSFD